MNARIPTLPLALVCAGLLAACQWGRLPDSKPLRQAEPIARGADYEHEPSHHAFPLAVADFRRVALVRNDTAGLDVTASYEGGSAGCPVRLTIGVAPAPQLPNGSTDAAQLRRQEGRWLDAAFYRQKRELATRSAVRFVEEAEWIQQGTPARKVTYAAGRDQMELLMLLENRTWLVTIGSSFPSSCTGTARTSLDAFLGAWHKPHAK